MSLTLPFDIQSFIQSQEGDTEKRKCQFPLSSSSDKREDCSQYDHNNNPEVFLYYLTLFLIFFFFILLQSCYHVVFSFNQTSHRYRGFILVYYIKYFIHGSDVASNR